MPTSGDPTRELLVYQIYEAILLSSDAAINFYANSLSANPEPDPTRITSLELLPESGRRKFKVC